MTEGNRMTFNEEILRVAARRALSVDNIDQVHSSLSATDENSMKSPDDDKISQDGSAASTVVITESELSSSWMYKNRKNAIDLTDENKTQSLPPLSTKTFSSSELGTVEFQNSGMKPVLIPTAKPPEKASSRCCYLTVLTMICICTIALLSAIGGLLYLEVFSVREQPESSTQMTTADELLRSAIKLKNRESNSNKFIPYESKDVLYTDIAKLLKEAEVRNSDDARHLREFPIPEDEEMFHPIDYTTSETAFGNISGRKLGQQFLTTTEDSIEISSTVSQSSVNISENSVQTSGMEKKNIEKKLQLSSEENNSKTSGVDEFSNAKDIIFTKTFEEGPKEKSSDSALRSKQKDPLLNSHFSLRKPSGDEDYISNHNSNDIFITTPFGEKENPAFKLEQKSSENTRSNEISLHPLVLDSSNVIQFEENFNHFLPEDTNETDVLNAQLNSAQNQQTIKSGIVQEAEFEERDLTDIIQINESSTLDDLEVIKSKVTVSSDKGSENASDTIQLIEFPPTDNQHLRGSKTTVSLNEFPEDSFHINQSNEFSTRDHLNLIESKPTVPLVRLSGQDFTSDALRTQMLESSFLKEAFKKSDEKEAFVNFNESDINFESDYHESTEIQDEQQRTEADLMFGSNKSKQMDLVKENFEDSKVQSSLIADQERKDLVSEIPFSVSDNLESAKDARFKIFTSGLLDSVSVTSIPDSETVAPEITKVVDPLTRRFGENNLSDASDNDPKASNSTEVAFNFNRPILSASIAPVNFLKHFQQKTLTTTTRQQPATPKRPEDLQASLAEVLKYLQPLDTKNKLPVSRTKIADTIRNVNGMIIKSNENKFTTASVPDSTTERVRYLQKLREMMFDRYFG